MRNDSPLVTVYIPCHNYGRYLLEAVNSVINQLYSNWELIIIDDGSTDETLAIARQLLISNQAKISLIENSQPKGLQRIANRVLTQAKGKYIIRLDADDFFAESALLLMVWKLESNPSLGLVYGDFYYVNTLGKIIGTERSHKDLIHGKDAHLPPHGACTMVNVRALKSVGGYSENINAQDGWELWYKLMGRVGVARLEAPLFYYRQHDDSLSRDSNRLLHARSIILEKIAHSLNGDYKLNCLAVIAVKESYPDFVGVPYYTINNKSLLEIALSALADSASISEIIVSSASQKVLDFSQSLETEQKVKKHKRILRIDSLDNDPVPINSIMKNAAEFYQQTNGIFPDIVVFLSIHAVNRKSVHVDKAINILRVTNSDTVFSVQEERDPIFSYEPTGMKLLNPGRFKNLIYDRERLYRFNGSIIASWWEIVDQELIFNGQLSTIEMSAADSLLIRSPVQGD